MAVQILILGIWLLVIPLVVGLLFVNVDNTAGKPLLAWITGQIFLWAGFQLICAPMVLQGGSFGNVVVGNMVFTAIAALAAAVCAWRRKGARLKALRETGRSSAETLLWTIFWMLLAFQLVQSVRMTYADGDDAFYVAVSSIVENSDTMYQKLPYTGGTTTLDIRHGLAPFPVWIAFLARISGMRTVSVAHVAVPVVLIGMTYAIFYLIGNKLFPKGKDKLPLFLIVTELLVLFGDYSSYTVENFMIARSRQGKAALGNIIIPALLLLLLLIVEQLQQHRKVGLVRYGLLGITVTAACLCSTMGAVLACLMIGIVALIASFAYKKPGILLPMGISCIPGACFALLYFILG